VEEAVWGGVGVEGPGGGLWIRRGGGKGEDGGRGFARAVLALQDWVPVLSDIRYIFFYLIFISASMLTTNWTEMNRRSGGRIIGAYRAPTLAPEESGVVTSLALGASTVVVGLANSTIQTFDVRTGARTRSLKGHTAGVWAVCLVEPGGRWAGGPEGDEDEDDLTPHQHQQYHEDSDDGRNSTAEMSMESQGLPGSPLPAPAPALALAPALASSSSSSARSPPRLSASASASSSEPRSPRRRRPAPALHDLGTLEYPHPVEPKSSDTAFASDGWGQPNTLVVSGGCDKNVRVWELPSGLVSSHDIHDIRDMYMHDIDADDDDTIQPMHP
jgi:WD40 repeat protein